MISSTAFSDLACFWPTELLTTSLLLIIIIDSLLIGCSMPILLVPIVLFLLKIYMHYCWVQMFNYWSLASVAAYCDVIYAFLLFWTYIIRFLLLDPTLNWINKHRGFVSCINLAEVLYFWWVQCYHLIYELCLIQLMYRKWISTALPVYCTD
jgi:hypothetical protein